MSALSNIIKTVTSTVIALILSCSFITGIFHKNEIRPIKPNPDPQPMSESEYEYSFPDMPSETDYSNLVLTKTDGNISSLKTAQIVLDLKDQNKGKGFYFYYIPFIEFYQNGEWIRLSYYPIETQWDEQWYFAASEDDLDVEVSARIVVNTKYIMETLIPGKYRIAQFAGPTVVYCEFEMM